MSSKPFIAAMFVLTLISAWCSLPAFGQQTDNHGLHAVPAPGKVVIDGKLDDWDLSGQVIMCYDLASLRDVYSAQVAMMYDADNLYVALHWKDQTPMGNSHDPRYQASKGWAGDCVQLRLKTDEITHVTAWYYAAKGEPTIHLDYGKDMEHPFGGGSKVLYQEQGWKLSDGSEMAFVKDADGKGYVQEIKLPWGLITKSKAYKAGDVLRCGFELLWGEGDWPVHRYADNLADGATSREFFFTAHNAWGTVLLEPAGHLKLPVPAYLIPQSATAQGPIEIKYDLPKDAKVTLAIDDQSGKRVRNLVAAESRNKGVNVEHWDGLDDSGKAVPPGEYKFRAIYHDGIHVNYVMSFATPGNPSWDTADGRGAFYGDHTAAIAAAAGGDYVALACPIGEAGKHLIGLDLKGQRLWGLADRVFARNRFISLATDGKILWVANEFDRSFVYRVDIATGKYAPWDMTDKDDQGKEYQVLELKVSDTVGDPKFPVNLSGIAVRKNVLAVGLRRDNQIKLIDATNGKLIKSISVPEPASVAFDTDNSLIVLSKDQLWRVSTDGTLSPFSGESIESAYSVVVDPAHNVYLSVRGKDQNVKVFSPEGKLVRQIGRLGGRPHNGPFMDDAMREPGQLAIDSQGRLWVPEKTMNSKRTSVWSLDGKFLLDFVGTTSYAGAAAINPEDPTMAMSDDTVYKIDLEKGSWRPVYSLGESDNPLDVFPVAADSHIRYFKHEGVTYAASVVRAGTSRIMMFKDGRWTPVAALGTVDPAGGRESSIKYAALAGHEGEAFAWADLNGDGLAQPQEITFSPRPNGGKGASMHSLYWGVLPDSEGTYTYIAPDSKSILKFPITAWSPTGAPIYDINHPQSVIPSPALANIAGEGMITGGTDGRVYINMSPLVGIDKDGHVLGTYPSNHVSVHGSHTAKASRSGYLIGPSSFLGVADFDQVGEVFDLNGNLGENYLFTQDALWIQSLFKDTRGGFETPDRAVRGMPMDGISGGGESFGGNFVRLKNGRVYLTIGGTDARVMEVTGLDSIRRFSGSFTYTQEQFAKVSESIAQTASEFAAPKVVHVARTKTAPSIDGKADGWFADDSGVIAIEDGPHHYAKVQIRYDDQNLYLAYRVTAHSNKIRNAGQDDRLLFKTGDCVDLMLGPAGLAKGQSNLRLLLSTMGDKPVGVLYEKTVAGTPEKARVPFSSPARTIYFDRVTRLPDGQVATSATAGGYFVEVAVPWSTLGVKPAPGLKLKADFGVLQADNGGTITAARLYWANKSTGLVNDIPGEADLAPDQWGTMILE